MTDITYVMTDEGWLYLAGVKDVFTCELVGYAMGPRMTQELTAQALWRAVRSKRPAPGLIHHSDRGTQYCADDYRKLVAQLGMQASMSRKGNCYDNAPMESFWGSLKNEMIHHQRYATRANAESAIKRSTSKSSTTASDATRALATYRQQLLQKTSAKRRWLLETEVSTIDSTPHSLSNRLIRTTGPLSAKANSYDKSGNLISGGSTKFTYRTDSRLAAAAVGGATTLYQYNGLG